MQPKWISFCKILKIPIHFHWIFMLFSNAFTDLQSVKYSLGPAHISDFRQSPSFFVWIINTSSRRHLDFDGIPLHFHWFFNAVFACVFPLSGNGVSRQWNLVFWSSGTTFSRPGKYKYILPWTLGFWRNSISFSFIFTWSAERDFRTSKC